MSRSSAKNIAASVRSRLLNLSRESGENFNLILSRYAVERLLYRISCLKETQHFVLKGAMLFYLWKRELHRPTRDLDLLGFGDSSPENVRELFVKLCGMDVDDDGLLFDPAGITTNFIREDQTYQGVQVKLNALLENARIPLQIDIGYGDAITPKPEESEFPVILDFPAPRLRSYPLETVIAEKVEAAVTLGLDNSRMKDFYDLYYISQTFDINGKNLVQAITRTFESRNSSIPQTLPQALSDEFAENEMKQKQWTAFVRKMGNACTLDFKEVITKIRDFLQGPLQAASIEHSFDKSWAAQKAWSKSLK